MSPLVYRRAGGGSIVHIVELLGLGVAGTPWDASVGVAQGVCGLPQALAVESSASV